MKLDHYRIFAREGAKLVLADVVEEGGNQTLKMVQELCANAIFVKCDVSQWNDVDAAVAKAVATYGRLDCAFNNAGIEGEGVVPGHIHERVPVYIGSVEEVALAEQLRAEG